MQTLETSLILGMFPCVFYALRAVPYGNVSIPEELRSVAARVPVNATPCSVTCGLGFQLEELCELAPGGERRNCTQRRLRCAAARRCGLRHVVAPAGSVLRLRCAGAADRPDGYTWRLAPGLVTTNDGLFRPFKNAGPVVTLAPAREAHAGTYRCDVQLAKALRLVKRVYFGVTVIRSDLVDLNFQKSLTLEQQIAENEEEGNEPNVTLVGMQQPQSFWRRKLLSEPLLGLATGVLGGVLGSIALYFSCKIRRRREMRK